MNQRVGIFSGTFDPIHQGHIAFAKQALEYYELDKIFFLVEPRPRRKQGVRAFEHRQYMVQLAVSGDPALGSIVLEQDRFTAHQTLPILKARFKGAQLFMLMGDDMLHHLGSWPHIDDLLKGVSFIVGLRKDSYDQALAYLQAIEKTRNFKLDYRIFHSEHSDYASSKIRMAYKRGRPPAGLDRRVRAYIEKEGLYAPGDEV
jgi:nicotinate-nucleotide adenylyltransferase